MNSKYTDEIKHSIFQRYRNNESVVSLAESTGIPHSTIYSWIRSFSSTADRKAELSAKNFRLLKNKVSRLEGIIEIIHKAHCFASDPLKLKLAAMEELYGQYIEFYNCKRPHKANKYKTPMEKEVEFSGK